MLTSNNIQFSAYCHECKKWFEVIPATKEGHRGMALNHSREFQHTCSLYKITGYLKGVKFEETDRTEVERFIGGKYFIDGEYLTAYRIGIQSIECDFSATMRASILHHARDLKYGKEEREIAIKLADDLRTMFKAELSTYTPPQPEDPDVWYVCVPNIANVRFKIMNESQVEK